MGDQSLHVSGYSSAIPPLMLRTLSKDCTGAAIHYQNAVHKLQLNSAPQGSIKCGAEYNVLPRRPNGLTCQAESFLNEAEDPSIEGPLPSQTSYRRL